MSSGAHKVYQTNGNVCREYCLRTTTVLFSLGYSDYSVLKWICMSFTLYEIMCSITIKTRDL